MAITERDVAVGVFDDRVHGEMAVKGLTDAGFTSDQIGMVIPDAATRIEAPHLPTGSLAEEGAIAGASGGAVIGAILGVGLTAALVPGVGLALVGGFLIATLAAAAGGSVVGALLGLGVPEEEAHSHAEAFHSGRTLVSVRAGSRYAEAVDILERAANQLDPREPARMRARLMESADDPRSPGAGVFSPRP